MQQVLVRMRGHQEPMPVQKPVCVVDYNKNMNGVDRIDQQIQYYPFVRKTIKWHKKYSMYLLELALHNAFILFKCQNPNSKINNTYHFILSVCRSWTGAAEPGRRAPPPPSPSPSPRPTSATAHEPMQIPPTPKKSYPTKRCVMCTSAGKRKEVRTICRVCKVALHEKGCFQAYHWSGDFDGMYVIQNSSAL
jgi:hypothetical protein